MTDLLPAAQFVPAKIATVLCDLDGVVWLAHEAIHGSVEAIADIREGGRRVLFVTNHSAGRVADHEAALAAIGIPASGDVISSSMAAAHLIEAGERVLITGGAGIVEAVEQRGAIAIPNDGNADLKRNGGIDVVLVGMDLDFNYARLDVTCAALHAGARLIGTNADVTYPTPSGLQPGGGSILAAVAAAGEQQPLIGGKPHAPMAALIADVLGTDTQPFDASTVVMVGDRPDTDGLMASRIGCPFALVRSGVTPPGVLVNDVDIALDVASLAAVAGCFSEA
jgi:4-nitrophenyl phosphatase